MSKNDLIKIDGSLGEGGGQILRTSLALSMITQKPFVISKIRANRNKPGLLRQHLTAVKAAKEVCRAKTKGDILGSQELEFNPNQIQPGEFHFSIGTAGSTTLVLQTILPALMTAPSPSKVEIEGGTHNEHAPPFDFLERTFLPILNKMGPEVNLHLDRPGFYPAGGGCITAEIFPFSKLKPIKILQRGQEIKREVHAVYAKIPKSIAHKEGWYVKEKLNLSRDSIKVNEFKNSVSSGNAVFFILDFKNVTEVFTGFGRRGLRLEKVCDTVLKEFDDYMQSDAPVGKYLADQLMLPMALSGSGSYRTTGLSMHGKTNISVIESFLDVHFEVKREDENSFSVKV